MEYSERIRTNVTRKSADYCQLADSWKRPRSGIRAWHWGTHLDDRAGGDGGSHASRRVLPTSCHVLKLPVSSASDTWRFSVLGAMLCPFPSRPENGIDLASAFILPSTRHLISLLNTYFSIMVCSLTGMVSPFQEGSCTETCDLFLECSFLSPHRGIGCKLCLNLGKLDALSADFEP